MKRVWVIMIAAVLAMWTPAVLADAPIKSSHYEVDESFIGGGGLINENSTNYAARESIGDVAVGSSASASYQTNLGYTTTNDPALTFIINNTSVNFGTLSTATTATANITFSVIDYTSYGYNVIIAGNPPTNGSHALTNLTLQTASTTGTEQFGLNLTANTAPISFGAAPVGGLGAALAGYGTTNRYKYVPNAAFISSPASSGQTNFTASYIVNASATTPAGAYSGSQSFICVATY